MIWQSYGEKIIFFTLHFHLYDFTLSSIKLILQAVVSKGLNGGVAETQTVQQSTSERYIYENFDSYRFWNIR
jgi:hypothetical protein